MKKVISLQQVKKNIFFSIGAQGFSVLVGLFFGFIIPKIIPQIQYAYWHIYLLYAGYVGVLHFGLTDGLVLRYSQYDYEDLDYAKIRSQFQFLLLITSLSSFIIVVLSSFLLKNINQLIAYLVAFAIIIKNIQAYTSFVFQLTNRIQYYASLTIINRGIYLIIIIGLLFTKNSCFIGFCLADILANLFSVFLMSKYNKGLYFGKTIPLSDMLVEAWKNISSGFLLMAANWSAMLVLGSSKMVIQWHWDTITFAKISFGFTLSNIFLMFIPAVSAVLFPTIKRLSLEKLPDLYLKIRQCISILIFVLMLGYFPGGYVLKLWLPKYADGIIYLGILLPLVVFSSKMTLLTNNYLKAYREEKKMFVINFSSIAIAFLLYLICAYILNNLTAMLISIVLMIMFRSILSEMIVAKLIAKNFKIDFIYEAIMSIVFIMSARYFSFFTGFFIYLFFLFVYMFFYKKAVLQLFKSIINSVYVNN